MDFDGEFYEDLDGEFSLLENEFFGWTAPASTESQSDRSEEFKSTDVIEESGNNEDDEHNWFDVMFVLLFSSRDFLLDTTKLSRVALRLLEFFLSILFQTVSK